MATLAVLFGIASAVVLARWPACEGWSGWIAGVAAGPAVGVASLNVPGVREDPTC